MAKFNKNFNYMCLFFRFFCLPLSTFIRPDRPDPYIPKKNSSFFLCLWDYFLHNLRYTSCIHTNLGDS